MVWFAKVMPYIAEGAQLIGQKKSSDAAADVQRQQAQRLADQAQTARAQSMADEEMQRRRSRQILGEQAASIAQTNTGSGGSNGLLAQQSILDAERDALTIRYGGQLKFASLMADSQSLLDQSKTTRRAGNVLAGTQLLYGMSRAYRTSKGY